MRKVVPNECRGPIDDMLLRAIESSTNVHELARAADVNICTIQRWLRGESTLTLVTADRLMRTLFGESCYLIIRSGDLDAAMSAARGSSAR
jgi:plasmid maintenance system antidote protein VapI